MIAGWLFGYRRWAKAIDGSFTWGLSRKGDCSDAVAWARTQPDLATAARAAEVL